jgi:succinoglycan biosynthesis protein ExoA
MDARAAADAVDARAGAPTMSNAGASAPFAHARDGSWPSVSVVVPVRNAKDAIEECIASLQRQDYPLERLEIVVADGGSTDGSAEAARRSAAAQPHPGVKVIANPKCTTASGLNLGIAASSGDVIVRLDAHSEAPPDYIRSNVEILYASGADCVGGKPNNVGSGYWGEAIALAMASRFGVGAHFRTSSNPGDVDTVAFGAFRRETFRRIGPFDEDLVYSEDNEYTHRIRTGGGRIYFDPAIQFTYHPRRSLPALLRQYHNYGWGRMRHVLRDGAGASLRHLAPMTLVGALGILGAASLASTYARMALGALLAIYLVAAAGMSIRIALAHGLRYLPALPLVFACLHIGYGVGQWHALASRISGRDRAGSGTR